LYYTYRFIVRTEMKNKLRLIVITSISILLGTSCISRKQMLDLYPDKTEAVSIDDFNGIYSNKCEGSNLTRGESLWFQFQTIGIKEKFDKWKRAEVELEVLNKRQIKATVSVKGVPIDTKILKGKFDNGSFVMKRRIKPKGIPLILFHYFESVTMLSFEDSNTLRVHTKHLKYGGFFLFLKGKKETETHSYKKSGQKGANKIINKLKNINIKGDE